MKKYFINLIIMILLLICQLLIGRIFPNLYLVPDFILIFIVLKAIFKGSKEAMIYGFSGGILQDAFLGTFIGIFTPVKTAVAFLSGLLSGRFFPENLLIPPLGVFLATIVHQLLYILLKENYLFNTNILLLFRELILPMAALNALITFGFYLLYFFLGRRNINWID